MLQIGQSAYLEGTPVKILDFNYVALEENPGTITPCYLVEIKNRNPILVPCSEVGLTSEW